MKEIVCGCKVEINKTISDEFKSKVLCHAREYRSDALFCGKPALQSLHRVSSKTPVITLCIKHHNGLINHQFCPVCGLFCATRPYVRCGAKHRSHHHCLEGMNLFLCPHCGLELTEELLPKPPKSEEKIHGMITFGDEHLAAYEYKTKIDRIEFGSFGAIKLFSFFEPASPYYLIQRNLKLQITNMDDVNLVAELSCKHKFKKNLHDISSDEDAYKLVILASLAMNVPEYSADPKFDATNFACHHLQKGNWLLVLMVLSSNGSFMTPPLNDMITIIANNYFSYASINDRLISIDQVIGRIFEMSDESNFDTLIKPIIQLDDSKLLKKLLPCVKDRQPKFNVLESAIKCESMQLIHLLCTCYPNYLSDQASDADSVYVTAYRQNNASIISYILSQYSKNYPLKRPNVDIPDTAPKTAAEGLHMLNSIAQKRKAKFNYKILDLDISQGRERTKIRLVNDIDDLTPNPWQYASESKPLNDLKCDESIQSHQKCNCTDGCISTKCNCVLLSEGRKFCNDGRLMGDIYTGSEEEKIPAIYECTELCGCPPNCKNRARRLPEGSCILEVFRTEKMGWGVRALQPIKRGSFITKYAGETINNNEADRREDTYLFDISINTGREFTYCIDAHRIGNFGRFFNHLCEPNMLPIRTFKAHQDFRFPMLGFFAKKDIKPGDELGFDYGGRFWEVKLTMGIECKCGLSKCKYHKPVENQLIME